MIRSLKAAFGLSLLAALVVSAMSVMSASAITQGHFSSEVAKTKYDIKEATGTAHSTKLEAYGSTIECHEITYTGHHTSTTTSTALTVTPHYTKCTKTADSSTATVHMKGCHYEFTPRPAPAHATAHFRCPTGVKAEVTTNAGTMKFGAQTPTKGGVVYETITMENKHAITANITVEGIHGTCHGACQIFGTTTTTGKLSGSVTVQGTNTDTGAPVHLTVT
jgi:hypothetical protein